VERGEESKAECTLRKEMGKRTVRTEV
jgi:hypothetical protein